MTAHAHDRPRADESYRCTECGERWYYTKPSCPACGADASDAATAPVGAGEVVAVTTVHATPADVRSPNRLALVRFDDGLQVIAQVADAPAETGRTVTFDGDYVLRDDEGEPLRGPRLTPIARPNGGGGREESDANRERPSSGV